MLTTISIIGLVAYILSASLLILLTIKIRKELTVQNLLISLLPIANTVALVIGLVSVISNWYNKNKDKPLYKANKPVKKKETSKKIPTPKG